MKSSSLIRSLIALVACAVFGINAMASPVTADTATKQIEKSDLVSSNADIAPVSTDTAEQITAPTLVFKDGDVAIDGQMLNKMIIQDQSKFDAAGALKALQKTSGYVYLLATPQQEQAFTKFLETEKSAIVESAKTIISANQTMTIARQPVKQIASNIASDSQQPATAPSQAGGS